MDDVRAPFSHSLRCTMTSNVNSHHSWWGQGRAVTANPQVPSKHKRINNNHVVYNVIPTTIQNKKLTLHSFWPLMHAWRQVGGSIVCVYCKQFIFYKHFVWNNVRNRCSCSRMAPFEGEIWRDRRCSTSTMPYCNSNFLMDRLWLSSSMNGSMYGK